MPYVLRYSTVPSSPKEVAIKAEYLIHFVASILFVGCGVLDGERNFPFEDDMQVFNAVLLSMACVYWMWWS
jgi:hypothetical protein